MLRRPTGFAFGGRAKDAAGPDEAAFVEFEATGGRGPMVKVKVVPGTIDGKTEEAA